MMQLPTWLQGVWTRDWIERADVRTSGFDVHYLQTPSAFADLRIPRDRRAFTNASSFADLTDADLQVLARQQGFAGFTTISGDLATWHREIDFQPIDDEPDIGRVERLDDTHMLEHAPDSSYIESWRSVDPGTVGFLALRNVREGRLERILLVAGDRFLYVRNRDHDLPAGKSLDSVIASTKASRAQIIAYLDCELSFGRVRGGSIPWEIQSSTLPWREGRHLELADDIVMVDGVVTPEAGRASAQRWSVTVDTFGRNELDNMFPARR